MKMPVIIKKLIINKTAFRIIDLENYFLRVEGYWVVTLYLSYYYKNQVVILHLQYLNVILQYYTLFNSFL